MSFHMQPPDKDTWNGQIIGYKISYADINEIAEVNVKTTVGHEHCEVQITDLKPFTTYRITVKTFNSVGPGPDSDFIRVTTNEGGKSNVRNDRLVTRIGYLTYRVA
jgi:hypothetical protein